MTAKKITFNELRRYYQQNFNQIPFFVECEHIIYFNTKEVVEGHIKFILKTYKELGDITQECENKIAELIQIYNSLQILLHATKN